LRNFGLGRPPWLTKEERQIPDLKRDQGRNFTARFIFGYAGSMENYLHDLGRKSGETVAIEP